MSGTTHRLKTIGRFWDAVASGEKNFEVRLNDRGFQKGDVLELMRLGTDGNIQLDYTAGRYSSEPKLVKRRVTFVLQGGQFGLDPIWCVMGLADIDAQPPPSQACER